MKKLIPLCLLLFNLDGFSQQTEQVDFKTADVKLYVDLDKEEVVGSVNYTFDILKETDSIVLDAKHIDFDYLEINGTEHVLNLPHQSKFDGVILNQFKPSKNNVLALKYRAKPKKALYFVENDGAKQAWTQGQGKYTSNWLPSIDDMNDKIEFDLTITAEKKYEVIANGKLLNKVTDGEHTVWSYDMKNPMSSYLVALVIGEYDKKVEYSKSGIPLEMYYYPEDSSKFEPTYRYTKRIFDLLEEEIGVPYPWQNYKQVPVKDFLYAGMENTGTTIFADSFVTDSIGFVDKNYVNVNAHELAHQWFGNLVTATSGVHHWLQEGFATYYALLAERDIFGDNYYYWRLYEYAQELLEQDKAGGSTSLLNPKSSSTTFYKKGAWVLHILREKVGDKAFRKAVKNYLKKHQFKNVETEDFIVEVEQASGKDLDAFVDFWIKSEKLNYAEMENMFFPKRTFAHLSHSGCLDFNNRYYPIDCNVHPEACKSVLLVSKDAFLKAKIVEQLGSNISKSTFFNKEIKVRQAIARTLQDIPSELRTDYESLLNDKSYITIETALFTLWQNYPQERHKYLNQTKGIIGLSDKNVRTLWLTLALITEGFEPENKPKYFKELTGYTSPKYGFEVRQNAFRYLTQIQACNDACKDNLKEAATHHNWRFKKFAKALLEAIDFKN